MNRSCPSDLKLYLAELTGYHPVVAANACFAGKPLTHEPEIRIHES